MPIIELEDIDFNRAIANIVASVALEGAALSHILNAEGEKIQKVSAMTDVSVQQLEDINSSVGRITGSISNLERNMRTKLMTALDRLPPPGTDFAIRKTDDAGNPLSGGVFNLSNANVSSNASSVAGVVDFGQIFSGAYTLTEVSPPPGHAADPVQHSVDVSPSGDITVDGNIPAANFVMENIPLPLPNTSTGRK
jgi:hypothetical protein